MTNRSSEFSLSKTVSALLIDGISCKFMSDNIADHLDDNYYRRGTISTLQTIGWILVDINGTKLPNILGTDIFIFYISDAGIAPQGLPQETGSKLSYNINTSCTTEGLGCTAWIIKQKNMKYLHSNQCSWSNPACE